MFSVHPQCYYDDDGFYRALAAQRARERREAEYRARLQEARYKQQFQDALRRKAYQDYLADEQRRRSMYPFINGFDSDEEYLDAPYSSYVQPTYERKRRFQSRDLPDGPKYQRVAINDEQEPRKTTPPLNHREHTKVFPERPSGSTYQHPTTKHSPESPPHGKPSSPRSPLRLDRRDQAAQKIQSFFRTNLPRYKSLKAISSVAEEFQKVVDNFAFPSVLDFADSDVVKLLYTSRNAPIHLHEHTLLNFLSRLDSIDSRGDERVRIERKNLVKEIERELEKLDIRKSEAWEASRASVIASANKDELESTPPTTVEVIPEPDSAVMKTVMEMDCHGESSLSGHSSSDVLTSGKNKPPVAGASAGQMPLEETTYNQESSTAIEEQIDIDKPDHDVVPGSDSMHPDLSTWEVVATVDTSDAPDGMESQQIEASCVDEEMIEGQ